MGVLGGLGGWAISTVDTNISPKNTKENLANLCMVLFIISFILISVLMSYDKLSGYSPDMEYVELLW